MAVTRTTMTRRYGASGLTLSAQRTFTTAASIVRVITGSMAEFRAESMGVMRPARLATFPGIACILLVESRREGVVGYY